MVSMWRPALYSAICSGVYRDVIDIIVVGGTDAVLTLQAV